MKCFADNGTSCSALVEMNCAGCNFYKSEEQKARDDENTIKRLLAMDFVTRSSILGKYKIKVKELLS